MEPGRPDSDCRRFRNAGAAAALPAGRRGLGSGVRFQRGIRAGGTEPASAGSDHRRLSPSRNSGRRVMPASTDEYPYARHSDPDADQERALGSEPAGLDSGADDYVSKSVAPEILLLRVRALLRGSAGQRPPSGSQECSFPPRPVFWRSMTARRISNTWRAFEQRRVRGCHGNAAGRRRWTASRRNLSTASWST